jgi:acetyl-CoA C-acetyltransferase
MAEAYIVAATRTAGGRKGGRLAGWHPADLAAAVLDSLVERSGAAPDQVEDVIMGCVMQAGEQSNNIARNAIMASGLPETVPGTSIDRQCGSSQQALHFAAQAVMSGSMDCVIAAGVESMTRVPMGLASSLPAKNGFGHYKSPNIEKRYPNIVFSQFTGAEMMAEKYVMGGDPVIMLDAPLHATERALKKAGMSIDDIDLFEVNEAFASVPTAWLKTTGADPAKLNVNGGAIALGHPLGCSGTKLMTTLINALKQRNKRYGLQTMCEGGGMANVTIVERL